MQISWAKVREKAQNSDYDDASGDEFNQEIGNIGFMKGSKWSTFFR